MNLRELCRISPYPTALLTTYSFDPLFFERVVLTDLAQGGASRIFVMADEEQALAAIHQAKGQLMSLGRRYRLIPIRRGSSFHPKLCIRLGPIGAVVACGSHNLTRSGWLGCRSAEEGGGNRESTFAWRVDPGTSEAVILRASLDRIVRLLDLAGDRDEMSQMLNLPWLALSQQTPPPQDWSWEVVGEDRTLASVLEDRWRGRRFQTLRMVTGSTDDRAAVISWAAKSFGVSKAVVEVDLSTCGFNSVRLKDLEAELRLQPYDGNPRTHMKVALFEGADGCAAVLGSANCSGAAWLRLARENGNIESVVILDNCNPADFAPLFRTGYPAPKRWQDLTLNPPAATNVVPAHRPVYAVKALRLHRISRSVSAMIVPAPSPNSRPCVVIQGSRVPLVGTSSGTWQGPMPDLVDGPETLFGHVEIETARGIERTDPLWVDDVDQLRENAGRHHRFDAVRRLSSSGPSGDYRRLLEDLHVLSHTILTRSEEFPDRIGDRKQEKISEPSEPPKPVTSAELIQSLDKLRVIDPAALSISAGIGSLSLSGIMAVLFAESSTTAVDPTESENERSDEERDQDQDEQQQDADLVIAEEDRPSESQRRRLIVQLEEFIDKLAAPEFASTCSARQLQQAAAFPLAVARFTSRGPWVEKGERAALAEIVSRECEVLFYRSQTITDTKTGESRRLGPLMQQVRERYVAEGRNMDYQQILGDGTLWLVLIASVNFLGQSSSQFERNLVLRDLSNFQSLLSSAIPEQLAPLARRLGQETDDALDRTKAVMLSIDALEAYLASNSQKLPTTTGRESHDGDWLWKPEVGFARVVELIDENTAKVHIRKRAETLGRVRLSFYLNLRVLSKQDSMLTTHLAQCGMGGDTEIALGPTFH